MSERLDFRFSPHDDMLEARLEGGRWVHISSMYDTSRFFVNCWDGKRTSFEATSIYEALDIANKWYDSQKTV